VFAEPLYVVVQVSQKPPYMAVKKYNFKIGEGIGVYVFFSHWEEVPYINII